MFTNGHDKMRISVVILNLDMLPRGPMDLKFGRAFQRSDGFLEGDICANVYGSFTLVPVK